jgi:hypothetical protein
MVKKRNNVIRQEPNVFIVGKKVKEYQQNYLEHTLQMPTYQIPHKMFDCILKKKRERSTTKQMERSIFLLWRSEEVKQPKPCS